MVPSSEDCDGDDWGQFHFAGIFHVSVDFKGFPFELSKLMYDKLDKSKRRLIRSFPIASGCLVLQVT